MSVIIRNEQFKGEEPPNYYDFSYEPDSFQKWGFKAIAENDNILVTAHTGAGKTALALYGIGKWLQQDNQVIYTSPIKTLSNQKYKEFGEKFDNVGILTGDVKINPTGNLLIMTAEILKNSLLRENNEKIYDWNFNPKLVKCVILDEVHFINNPNRGYVWEEIIKNLDPNIQLIMLSATISGAEKLAEWVAKIKNKNCHLIPTSFRPVPLCHYLYWDDEIHLVKDNLNWKPDVWTKIYQEYKKQKEYKFNLNRMFELIDYCHKKDKLPMNLFLLNREQIEIIGKKIPYQLLEDDEIGRVKKLWDKYLHKYISVYEQTQQYELVKKLVLKGIGIHHSGLIPILKDMIEILYEHKLIKVLLATETFAMGVNMPTKTVVFSQTSKYDGITTRPFRPEEYNQMAGRAGRRGMDKFGMVIIMPEPNLPTEREAIQMITSDPQRIESRMILDYNFIMKHLVHLSELSKDEIVNRLVKEIQNSFLSKENNSKLENYQKEIEEIDKKLQDYQLENKDEFIEMKDLELELEKQKTSIFKLNSKIVKKYRNKINKVKIKLKSNLKIYNSWYSLYQQKIKLETELEFSQEQFKYQLETWLNFLHEEKMIDDEYKLTHLGRMIAEVNECNSLIIAYLFDQKIFDNLEYKEIIALLSIFIADRSDTSLEDLEISKDLKEILINIESKINYYQSKETQINNNLPLKVWSNWNIDYSFVNVILKWSQGEITWKEAKEYYSSFEGNFCKNILRLVNLVRNIENMALLNHDFKLINKIYGYQESLIRDIVTIDSLYLV